MEDWPAARRAVRSSPNDHWLLTLRPGRGPNCPLPLWDYAGSLEMLDQTDAALKVYLLLAGRGIQQIAFGDWGEGLAWARGQIADCHYRMAHCYTAHSARRWPSSLSRATAVFGAWVPIHLLAGDSPERTRQVARCCALNDLASFFFVFFSALPLCHSCLCGEYRSQFPDVTAATPSQSQSAPDPRDPARRSQSARGR